MQRFKMRSAVLALALSCSLAMIFASTQASANDVTNNITGLGGTTFFGALHTDSFDFTDVFTFDAAGEMFVDVSLTTIGAGFNNIDFLTADLNGLALTLSPTGFVETGSLGTMQLTGPLVLTITGRSGASGGTFASYAGTMNVSPVPEPSTALLIGLGLVGLASRRVRSA